MDQPINRRQFLKLLTASALVPFLKPGKKESQQDSPPNVLILVCDALSAQHLSLYGYPRRTTPNIERFAERAIVYHNHFAAANFTTPGTASLLTGAYPWSHRAFNTRGTVTADFIPRNIFAALEGAPYYRTAFSHNDYAVLFFNQFRKFIDFIKPNEDLFLANEILLDGVFPRDLNAALLSEDIIFPRDERLPASLFLSIADQWRRRLLLDTIERSRGNLFPLGFPMVDEDFHPFILEDATNWLLEQLENLPKPFFMYHHVLPPHEPYRPRREFIDLFEDGWKPVSKKEHFFSQHLPQTNLDERRRYYDRYIAYVDAEFGRVYDALAQNGLLENTLVILTSDHGQMFERGIHGHITPTLYHPLLHIPLLISQPGHAQRIDIYDPTSAVDILPTILNLSGIPATGWAEGEVLPPFNPSPTPNRDIFALEAKTSFKYRPLIAGTVALMRGPYKLVRTFGFRDYNDIYEMYDLENDPEELNDIYPLQVQGVKRMRSDILNMLDAADRPYR